MNSNIAGGSLAPPSDHETLQKVDWLKLAFYHVLAKQERWEYGDERTQIRCRKDFDLLSQSMKKLNPIFEAFRRALRPISGSSRLIRTSEALQHFLNIVFDLFKSNAAEIWKDFSGGLGSDDLPNDLQFSRRPEAPSAIQDLPGIMYGLSETLKDFMDRLCDIQEFLDQRLMDALHEFREWLRFRAVCILIHRGSGLLENRTTRQYIGQVMKEMTRHIFWISEALTAFNKDGFNVIRGAQEQEQNRLQNMSTVATFLSAVTATTMQYTMNKAKSVVMGFWISSLILSIASAINSQLVIHWKTAMYRSPQELLPVVVWVCQGRTILLFLVAAVLAFSAGLIIWTIAADLALAVRVCAGTLVAAAFIVLLAVGTWDILEWWEEKAKEIKLQQAPIKSEEIREMQKLREWWLEWKGLEAQRGAAGEPNGRPVATSARERVKASRSANATLMAICKRWRRWKDRKAREGTTGQPNERPVVTRAPESSETALAPRERLQMLVRKIILYRWLREFVNLPLVFEPKPHSSQLNRLYDLHPVHELQAFHPFGYDISFAPDGSHLAVGQMKGNVAIWQVDNLDREPEKIIKCPVERARFAWSPNSSHLAITTKKGLVIQDTTSWSKPVSYRTSREPAVVAWLQSVSHCHVIGVVQDTLHIFNAESKATTTQKFDAHPSVTVLDLASIPPPQSPLGLVLVLGIMKDEAPDSSKIGRPRTASVERLLILMDLDNKREVAAAPILGDARNLSVSRNGRCAVVSYGDGAWPELWQLRDLRGKPQLLFRGTFAPHGPRAQESDTKRRIFSKACFCGNSDQWVMAADGSSNICVWRRATRYLLHTLRPKAGADNHIQNNSSIHSLTCTIKGEGESGMIIVSTCERGGGIIWRHPSPRETKEDSPDPEKRGPSRMGIAKSNLP